MSGKRFAVLTLYTRDALTWLVWPAHDERAQVEVVHRYTDYKAGVQRRNLQCSSCVDDACKHVRAVHRHLKEMGV